MTGMLLLGLVVAVLAGAFLGTARAVGVSVAEFGTRIASIEASLAKIAAGPEVPYREALRDLEHRIELLPQKWEEFKNEARRAENRARAVVRDAQKELDRVGFQHEGVEAAGGELLLPNADQRRDEAMPAVRPRMEQGSLAFEDFRERARRVKYGQ